jgi:hypothetical protein
MADGLQERMGLGQTGGREELAKENLELKVGLEGKEVF